MIERVGAPVVETHVGALFLDDVVLKYKALGLRIVEATEREARAAGRRG
jgi:hypothetical protein